MKVGFFLISIVIVSFSCTKPRNSDSLLPEDSDLAVGQPTDTATLELHKADTFKVNLRSGALVHGYADQLTVDVVVEVFDHDNNKVATFDSPARGKELFQFATQGEGVHRIVVSPFEENTGDYYLVLDRAEPLAGDAERRIRQLVDAELGTRTVTPGVSIAVQHDGNVIYSEGFGLADLEHEIPISPTTVFHIASVSKQFTAFAIALLADQGKLSMQDDIRKYLPELHDFGKVITIDHLVHHTSGLRDQWNLLMLAGWRLDDVITQKQIMRMISKQRELNFNPGDEMVYCNTGFTLMAEIVSRVTGDSFPGWCRKNIFDPLGMKNTLFYDDHEKLVRNRAYSYHEDAGGFKKSVLSYANAGATSLFTTVEDLSLWAANFDRTRLGSAEVMKMMDRRFVLNKGDTISYAFGQSLGKYKGLRTASHGGGDAGFRTFLLRFPDEHFSVSVFSNLASFNPAALSYRIADLYLADNMREEEQPEQQPPPHEESPEKPFDPASVILANFAGKYYSPELETSYTFQVTNETLTATHQRHDDMKLKPIAVDRFESDFLGRLDFVREGARIKGFKVSNGRVRNLWFEREQDFALRLTDND